MIGNYGLCTIEEYLRKGPYYIPDYQRDYSWDDKNEIQELWEDIKTVYDESIEEFFMGQIVLHNDEVNKKHFIIDGQQRTIALTLLYLAFRNMFNTLSSTRNDKAEKQVTKINSSFGLIDKEDHEEKLYLGDSDNTFFVDKILYGNHEDIKKLQPKRKAQKNLVAGYRFLYAQINEFCEGRNNNEKRIDDLCDLYKTTSNSFKLLTMETSEESEAFMIFETLNARGKDLETSDLLKNYFFRISNTNSNANLEVKKNWNIVAKDFESESITNYIRCIWNSQHTFEREKMLYKTISRNCRTTKEALEFSKVMIGGKDIYLSMVDPDSRFALPTKNETRELKNIMLNLSDLKIKTYYPLIMSYYFQNKNESKVFEQITKILRAIETLIFREIIICKNNPNTYEKIFSEIAKSLSDMTFTSVDDVIGELKKASCDEDEFKMRFYEYQEKGTPQGKNKIRYVLRKIIDYEAKEMKVSRNNSEVHIEHIMPVSLGEWDISEDEHDSNLWKLGNLTLLDHELNEDIKNSLFDVKCKEYEKSEIKMTKDLIKYDKWDVDEINKRQKKLYSIAKEIWIF